MADVALVCGGGGALGSEIARTLLVRGDQVIVADRSTPAEEPPPGLSYAGLDLTSPDEVTALWDRLEAADSSPRWVVNAAGGFRTGTVADSEPGRCPLPLRPQPRLGVVVLPRGGPPAADGRGDRQRLLANGAHRRQRRGRLHGREGGRRPPDRGARRRAAGAAGARERDPPLRDRHAGESGLARPRGAEERRRAPPTSRPSSRSCSATPRSRSRARSSRSTALPETPAPDTAGPAAPADLPVLELLYEVPGLPAYDLPAELAASYGGSLGFAAPCLFTNFVQTIDGVVAIPSVPSSNKLIAGESAADRFVLGLLRACCDVLLIGSGTLAASPRSVWTPEQAYPAAAAAFAALRQGLGRTPVPLVAVISGSGRVDPDHPVFAAGALVLTTDAGRRAARRQARRRGSPLPRRAPRAGRRPRGAPRPGSRARPLRGRPADDRAVPRRRPRRRALPDGLAAPRRAGRGRSAPGARRGSRPPARGPARSAPARAAPGRRPPLPPLRARRTLRGQTAAQAPVPAHKLRRGSPGQAAFPER